MLKHSKNIKKRIIYFTILFITFRELFVLMNLSLNLAMYGICFLLFFFYYLFDTINFNFNFKKKDIFYSVIINFVGFSIFYFFYKENYLVLSLIGYTLIQNFLSYALHEKEKRVANTLIIGEKIDREVINRALENLDHYKYVGYISDENNEDNYLGKIEEIERIVEENNIENIIFTKIRRVKDNSDILLNLKLKGIRVVDYLTFLEEFEGKIDVDKIDSFWVLMTGGFNSFYNNLQKNLKRAFDLILSIGLFILFTPFMLFTYILVKFDVGAKYIFINPMKIIKNPAFFMQKRIGYEGREFEIIKFRSMKIHDPNKYSKYASETDDRITKIGHFIRKTRLDELPQVINVIRGDMSFVGPRPEWNELGREYEKKIKNYHLRYSIRPGITGWAQTMFSYGASLDDAKVKLEYDLYYIKNQSFILDMIILFKTSKTILFRKGM